MPKFIFKVSFLIFLLILIGVAVFSYDVDFKIQEWQKKMLQIAREEDPSLFEKGERLIFKVNFKSITIGNAELVFEPKKDLDFVRLLADLRNLYDLEEIYADKLNLRPLKIKRTVKIFGQSMDITEEYDQKQNFVKIVKNKNAPQKIQSNKPLDNAILITYTLRKAKQLNQGNIFDFNLPTRKIKMKVKAVEKIKVPLGTYDAYRIESQPAKFKIWIDTSASRLPLRIEGVAFLGLATLNLAEVK